jgi:hypothetical protein
MTSVIAVAEFDCFIVLDLSLRLSRAIPKAGPLGRLKHHCNTIKIG